MAGFDIKENINKSIEPYKKSGYDQKYERFDFLYDQMRPYLKKAGLKILDIGCGDSAFFYYLKKRNPDNLLYGLEISDELIEKAKNEPFLKDVKLFKGDARDFKIDEKFDIAILAGVLSIFDDIDPVIKNMIGHLKPGGMGFIFGSFCTKDIDVIVRFRNNHVGSKEWESGLNLFSLKTVKKAIEPYSESIESYRFELKTKLPEQENPIRSYTLEMKDGKNLILTGANLVMEFYTLKFRKRAGK